MFKALDKFFFTEHPTYNLAFFRIVWGSLVFLNVLFEIGNIADFYGPEAIVSLETVSSRIRHFHFSLFHLFKESLATAYGIYFFTLISLMMVTIGYYTRVFLFFSLIGLVSLHMRNTWILSSADVLIRCIFFILIWSPCYNVLSIDSWLANKRGEPKPVNASQWTWRLIQMQIAVVYLWTFWSKVKGENWIDGSAVYYATRLETMRNFTIPWLLDTKVIIKFLTWGTLAIELALGTLVWFKKTRTVVILLGISLHLGIEVAMAIPFFEWIMIVLLMNFYNPDDYVHLYRNLKSKCLQLITIDDEGLT
ncbi:MAG TPA: HTTM domain-containing protein [Bacteriovoracaceae bacterium]|nr:HTTM domain-containing protein [Bacteriovoracaceae bacterium]